MSKWTINRIGALIRNILTISFAAQVAGVAALFGVLLSTSVQAQDVGGIVAASKAFAEGAPLEITRLSLQIAGMAMLINLVLVFAAFRLAAVWLRKPCLLGTEQAGAIIREEMRDAVREIKRG